MDEQTTWFASGQVRLLLSAREGIDGYMKQTAKKPGDYLFSSRRCTGRTLTPRQFARPVSCWIAGIGLDASFYGPTRRRTKATIFYRRTGNLRAVQLLLGHRKTESTVRYLGIEVGHALATAEPVDV